MSFHVYSRKGQVKSWWLFCAWMIDLHPGLRGKMISTLTSIFFKWVAHSLHSNPKCIQMLNPIGIHTLRSDGRIGFDVTCAWFLVSAKDCAVSWRLYPWRLGWRFHWWLANGVFAARFWNWGSKRQREVGLPSWKRWHISPNEKRTFIFKSALGTRIC